MQKKVINDIRSRFDYSTGKKEILLSGSVGSSKSLLLAHCAITHCILYPGAACLVGRKAMPQLKLTILQKILEHIGMDLDFDYNKSTGLITFANGSRLIPYSWADGKFKKARSFELSAAIIEEGTESEDKEFYEEVNNRIGRLPNVQEQWIMIATNPDSPSHWIYERFFESDNTERHVYLSRTEDNPFLDANYIRQLKADLDPKMVRRMIYGEWLEIGQDVVYHQYDPDIHYKDEEFVPYRNQTIYITFDFNLAEGKPMSNCAYQFINGHFHFFDEAVVMGADTEAIMDELGAKGMFEYVNNFVIHGDATGRSRDTRSKTTDYDIIRRWLETYRTKSGRRLLYDLQVRRSNPPIRSRHNLVNSYLKNGNGEVRLTVYKGCPTLNKGFRLTQLKKGGSYIEDDSKSYQHITTAAGYGICWDHDAKNTRTAYSIKR